MIFNQFSHVFIGLVLAAFAIVFLRWWLGAGWRTILAAEIGIAAVFTTGFLVLRPGIGDVDTVAAAESLLRNDRPTFVELFSNFCTSCLVQRPTVDGVVNDIDDEFNIMRINIHAPVGREMRERFDFSYSPEFILFNDNGVEVWRGHTPPTEKELALAQKP